MRLRKDKRVSVTLLDCYHRLPTWVRSAAATARGTYLYSWRYGSDTNRLVESALERERWSPDEWKRWQQEQLSTVLYLAATKVPYYRNFWNSARRLGNGASWEYLENWPILEKKEVHKNPTAFLVDGANPKKMFREHTSGTTGIPLDLYWSRDAVRGFYALFEARWRLWYGVSRSDRWAILGGQLVTPIGQNKPPFWVWNAALRQLYMSSYHLSPALIGYYLEALKRYRVKYIFGYSSSLFALAQEIIRLGNVTLRMHVAITNAEPLYEYQRDVIGRAFDCQVRQTYGNSEIVTSASECDARRLHLWPELGFVEVIGEEDCVEYVETGEVIATSLLNIDMPLIRYRLGDQVQRLVRHESCSCGRTLPQLLSVEGRKDDVLYTPDGRSIGRLDPVFKTQLPIREAQIVQDSLSCVRVRYVPTAGFDQHTANTIITRLRERMGPIDVVLEELMEIPREKNGKFRAVKCNLSLEQRESLTRRS